MDSTEVLARQFEARRGRLHQIAYRLLGSTADAEDAVQDAWLRVQRHGTTDVQNLDGWLNTLVARLALDMLRSRKARPDRPPGTEGSAAVDAGDAQGAEAEAILAETVGRALLVVLDRLTPTERVAFVLHDSFGMPFGQIAEIMGSSATSAKTLASRARTKIRGEPAVSVEDLRRERDAVARFLAAAREGDITGLLAVLAPDVTRRADPSVLPAGAPAELRGARAVAEQTVVLSERARVAEPALVNGHVGLVLAVRGRLQLAITVTVVNEAISEYEVIAEPVRLRQLELAILEI